MFHEASSGGGSGESSIHYIHTDHLTGSNVVTDENADIAQLLDYYPYGDLRIDDTTTFDEQRKFTGHELDRDTNLTYANARYYRQDVGRFLSQDPVFLDLGDEQRLKDSSGLTHRKYLSDPQTMNAYAYVANNPLKHVDKGGEWLDTVVDIGFIIYDAYKIGQAFATGGDIKGEAASLGLDVVGAVTPFATGLGMAARVTRTADKAGDAIRGANRATDFTGISKQFNWGNPNTLIKHTKDHAADFGLAGDDYAGYAQKANDFLSNAKQQGFDAGYNPVQKSLQFYDRKTNTFGAFDLASQATKTFLKPSAGSRYIENLTKRGEWRPLK